MSYLSSATRRQIPPSFLTSIGMLQRKCACGGTPGPTGECETCKRKRLGLQSTLTISKPGDRYEKEADEIAESVVNERRTSGPLLESLGHAASTPREGLTSDATAKPQVSQGETVRRKSVAGSLAASAPPIVHDVLGQNGQPLEPATREFMGKNLGYDFTRVRVHTDARAAASARVLGANAYTVGNKIVFDSGHYRPGSAEGRRLLAHELAHVVQQSQFGFRPESAGPLQRQSKSSGALPFGVYQYDRSNFSDRFDGEVDTRNHRVTLTMRLALNDAVAADSFVAKWKRIVSFFMAAKELIENTWRNTAFGLKSSCMAEHYSVQVNLLLDYGNPHQTITLWGDRGERSNSTNWQLSDTTSRIRTTPVLVDVKKPPSPDNLRQVDFAQVPVMHEFGHLMGLDHPLCKGEDTRCYGVTFEQKDDLMGYGSTISARDMEPFIKIMKRYGQEKLPRECNDWKAASD
ncbi:MAG TPA: DUF4157 domain-containing protein [Chthoniobacterales bacterium]